MGKNQNRKFDYGCVMADLNLPYWDSLVNRIEEADVYHDPEDKSFGREYDPHVTILFGLHEYIPDSFILEACRRIKPISLKIKSVSAFRDNEDYDVLKFDIKSPYLHFLNKAFKKFPHTSSYPSYNPHITLSYLKKGHAEKYYWLLDELPTKRIMSEEIVYSKTSGEKLHYVIN